MLNVLPEINWLAVLVSTVIFAALGGAYFSVIVAKPYKVVLGNQDRELPKPGLIFIVGPLISSLLVVITSAVLIRSLAIDDLGAGIVFGLIVSIGYLIAQTFTIAINPNFPRPVMYTLLNAPYFIICTVAASAILTVWR